MTAEYTPEQTPPRQCPECGGLFGHTEDCPNRADDRAVAVAEALAEHARWEHGTGADGYPTHHCRCGTDLPHARDARVAPLHRAHVTAAILAALSPTAAEQVSAARAVADEAAADTARALGDT